MMLCMFCLGYGLTETSPLATIDRVPARIGSVGQAMSSTYLKVYLCFYELMNLDWSFMPYIFLVDLSMNGDQKESHHQLYLKFMRPYLREVRKDVNRSTILTLIAPFLTLATNTSKL